MDPSVSVVIPTYERPVQLEQALRALVEQDLEPFEVIVVDDGPSLAGREAAMRMSAQLPVRYVAEPGHGAAAARNRGARAAQGDFLVFLDDDMLLAQNGLSLFAATLLRWPKSCVNGQWEFAPELRALLESSCFGRFRLEVEEWMKTGVAMDPLANGLYTTASVTASDLAVRRDDFLALGGFDETFPYAGYEDQELSFRARAAGFRLLYSPSIACLHDDRRLDRAAFLERLRRGAVTAVLMAVKHPDAYRHRRLIRVNSPVAAGDSPLVVAEKLLRRAAASTPVRTALHLLASTLERVLPLQPLLNAVYWRLCGVYLHLGVREGIRRYGAPVPTAGAAPRHASMGEE